jgi:nicotinate-nucleotide pyrophosphorylase (carboxylating)
MIEECEKALELPKAILRDHLKAFLEEDVGLGDVTTSLIVPSDTKIRAQILVKESAVIAGLSEMNVLFNDVIGARFKCLVNDGDEVSSNTIIAEVEGDGRSILMAERTALNLLSRMCGIATATRKLVKRIKDAGLNVYVAGTRKTAPGLRYFDKKAVIIGGGDPHRFKLDDQILIKDNHIVVAGGVKEALRRAHSSASFSKKIEIEVKTSDEAIEAAKSGADIIMLDNMSIEEIDKIINALKRLNLREKVLIEVSGRINEGNILEYARLRPDIISVGEITHSVKSIDISLEVIGVE